MPVPVPAADLLIQRLGALMGPEAARSTVHTFCRRTVGVAPEALTSAQLSLVLPSIKPMLSILIGTSQADALLTEFIKELAR